MIHTEYAVRSLRSIAGVLISALVLWGAGFPTLFNMASAANVTDFSDTLSDSAPTVVSDHTIEFTLTTAMAIGEDFTITFPGSFNLTAIDESDIDVASSSADQTVAAASGNNTWGVTVSGQTITFETPTNVGVGAGVTIEVQIGTNATGGVANAQIVNGTVGSHQIDLAGSMTDTGTTNVFILNNVLVSASVETIFTFTVNGVANGQAVNGSPTTTATTTTSTTLPFETLAPNVSKTLAQDLTVTTNANSGFVVTVEQDGDLLSPTAASINGFIDGAYTNTPAAWVAPSANVNDDETWGHWGLTSSDPDLFGSNLWVSASTTPRTVFSHTSVVNASTTRVGYQAQISNLQEAGDYTAVLTYIATPTF